MAVAVDIGIAEKERKKMLLQMGQDPYLDSPS